MKNYFEIQYEISRYTPMDEKTKEALKREASRHLLRKVMEEIEKNIEIKYTVKCEPDGEEGLKIYLVTEAFLPDGIL